MALTTKSHAQKFLRGSTFIPKACHVNTLPATGTPTTANVKVICKSMLSVNVCRNEMVLQDPEAPRTTSPTKGLKHCLVVSDTHWQKPRVRLHDFALHDFAPSLVNVTMFDLYLNGNNFSIWGPQPQKLQFLDVIHTLCSERSHDYLSLCDTLDC